MEKQLNEWRAKYSQLEQNYHHLKRTKTELQEKLNHQATLLATAQQTDQKPSQKAEVVEQKETRLNGQTKYKVRLHFFLLLLARLRRILRFQPLAWILQRGIASQGYFKIRQEDNQFRRLEGS